MTAEKIEAQFDKVMELYNQGKQKAALDGFSELANQGHPESQNMLGCIYGQEWWRKENRCKEAIEWHTKAAEQGDVDAQVNLGIMYKNGRGTEINCKEAAKLFTKAAEAGDEEAQIELADMYEKGKGVEKDYEKAFELYSKAADQGSSRSKRKLASMYYNGKGVKQDKQKARKLHQAADNKLVQNAKTFVNSDNNGTEKNVKDLEFYGNKDAFQLICKASSQAEGWMKSTKAMEIKGVGCLVQVTTQQGASVAEALTFVSGAKIAWIDHNDHSKGRKLVKI